MHAWQCHILSMTCSMTNKLVLMKTTCVNRGRASLPTLFANPCLCTIYSTQWKYILWKILFLSMTPTVPCYCKDHPTESTLHRFPHLHQLLLIICSTFVDFWTLPRWIYMKPRTLSWSLNSISAGCRDVQMFKWDQCIHFRSSARLPEPIVSQAYFSFDEDNIEMICFTSRATPFSCLNFAFRPWLPANSIQDFYCSWVLWRSLSLNTGDYVISECLASSPSISNMLSSDFWRISHTTYLVLQNCSRITSLEFSSPSTFRFFFVIRNKCSSGTHDKS